jgi:hypothetical protein
MMKKQNPLRLALFCFGLAFSACQSSGSLTPAATSVVATSSSDSVDDNTTTATVEISADDALPTDTTADAEPVAVSATDTEASTPSAQVNPETETEVGASPETADQNGGLVTKRPHRPTHLEPHHGSLLAPTTDDSVPETTETNVAPAQDNSASVVTPAETESQTQDEVAIAETTPAAIVISTEAVQDNSASVTPPTETESQTQVAVETPAPSAASNQAPTVSGIQQSINEDTPVTITLAGSDPENDALSYTVDGAQNGTVVLSGNQVTFTPTANFNGAAKFSYKAYDAQNSSESAEVDITVNAVNDGPTLPDLEFTTNEETPVVVKVGDKITDPEGDTVGYNNHPYNCYMCQVGISDSGASTFSYTVYPIANFYGDTSFQYQFKDSNGAVSTGTVVIHVNPVNDPPVPVAKSAITTKNMPVKVVLDGYDTEGDQFTYQISGQAHGTAKMISERVAEFTPDKDYTGSDASFSYTVDDGKNTSFPAHVSIDLQGWKVPGKTYHIAKTGSDDTKTNDGSEAKPFLTLASTVKLLQPGDQLIVHEGTYEETLFDTIPSGTDWDHAVTIRGNPGDIVTLKPADGMGCGRILYFYGNTIPKKYIIVDNVIVDSTYCTSDAVKLTGGANHIRISNSELKNSKNQGVLVTSVAGSTEAAGYHEFIHLHVHHNGIDDYEHGFYVATNHNLIDGCTVHDNTGQGMKAYIEGGDGNSTDPYQQTSYNVFRNNVIFDNTSCNCGNGITNAIGLYTGIDNEAYNNLIWGHGGGIVANYHSIHPKIYNNTVASTSNYGITIFQSDTHDAEVYNNIVANCPGIGIMIYAGNTAPLVATVRNNIMYNNGVIGNNAKAYWNFYPGTSTAALIYEGNLPAKISTDPAQTFPGTDPLFVDAVYHNYQLQSSSPALNAGTTVQDVSSDINGQIRPNGAAYDVGVYEGSL